MHKREQAKRERGDSARRARKNAAPDFPLVWEHVGSHLIDTKARLNVCPVSRSIGKRLVAYIGPQLYARVAPNADSSFPN